MKKTTWSALTIGVMLAALSGCASETSPAAEPVDEQENVGVVQSELYRDPDTGACGAAPACPSSPEPLGQFCSVWATCSLITRKWTCHEHCEPIEEFTLYP